MTELYYGNFKCRFSQNEITIFVLQACSINSLLKPWTLEYTVVVPILYNYTFFSRSHLSFKAKPSLESEHSGFLSNIKFSRNLYAMHQRRNTFQ